MSTPTAGTGEEISGCNSLLVTAPVEGSLALQAGTAVLLDNGFQVAAGSVVTVGLDPILASPFAYLIDDSPAQETEYFASFLFRLDDYSFTEPNFSLPFGAFDESGSSAFFLAITRDDTLNRNLLVGAACNDSGTCLDSVGSELPLAPGWNQIRMHWKASAGNGFLKLSVNDSPLLSPTPQLEALDNDTFTIDFVCLGLLGGSPGPDSGALHFEEFASWK